MSTAKKPRKIIRTPKGFRRLKLNEKRRKGDLFLGIWSGEWIGLSPFSWGVPVWRGDYPVIRKIKH